MGRTPYMKKLLPYNNKLQGVLRGLKEHYTLLLLMENNTGGWVNGCEIANRCEKGKKVMHVSRTAAAEHCCFLGDGKRVFRFILKGSLLLYEHLT